MIVGEALSHRADLQKRVGQIEDRLQASALVQDGDKPPEDPEELLTELGSLFDELQELIAKINLTNASTRLPSGETVTEGLARRDVLTMRQGGLRGVVQRRYERRWPGPVPLQPLRDPHGANQSR